MTATTLAIGMLSIDASGITGDGTINIEERAAGFAIGGTATIGASVTLTVGGTALAAATVEVDLTAPIVRYATPASLKVDTAATINPITSDTDIASCALAAGQAPPAGLRLDTSSGKVTGTPTARGTGATATQIVVHDRAGNSVTVRLSLPRVEGLAQELSGFAYSPAEIDLGDDAPTLTAPTGALGALTYSASPASVCTVDEDNGALEIEAEGTCTVVATAAATARHEPGTAMASVKIDDQLATPVLSLSMITKDSVRMSWNRVDDAEGYELRWSACSDCAYEEDETKALFHDVPNLSGATRYEFGVRATSATKTASEWGTKEATTNVEVQIRARRLSNGKVEWVLRYRSGDQLEPDHRFADPAKMTDGEWNRSETLEDDFDGKTYVLGRVRVRLDNTVCPSRFEVGFLPSDGGAQIMPTMRKFRLDTAVNTWLTTEWFELPLGVLAAAGGSGTAGGESEAGTSLEDSSGVADPGPGAEGGLMEGDGAAGEQAAATSDACADEPSGLTTSLVTATAATLNWTAVTGATEYDVRRDAGTSTEITDETTTSHRFTGLTAGTTYSLGVRARNPLGASGWSSISVTTVPPPPDDLSASGTTTSLTLSWDGSGGASSYKVKRSGSTHEEPKSATDRSHTFSGLDGATEYTLSVRALNASGASGWVSIKHTTKQLADPTNVTADSATSSSLTLNWDGVAEATSYKVKRSGSTDEESKAASDRSHTLEGLDAETEYTLSVRAVNSGGNSNWVAATASTAASTYTFEGRARARIRASGRVEFCFQPRGEDCIEPASRYITPADMEDGRWYHSSNVPQGSRTLGKISVMKPEGASYIDVCFTPAGGSRACPTPNNFYWKTATVDAWRTAGWISYTIADGSSGSAEPPASDGAMSPPNADEPVGGDIDGGAMGDEEPDPAGS